MIETKEKVNKIDKNSNYKLSFNNKFYKASSLVIIISIILTIVYSIYVIKAEIPVTPSYEEQLLQKLQTKEGILSKEEVEILLNTYGKYKILQMLFTQEFIEEEYTYEEFLVDYRELKDKLIFRIALLYDEKNISRSKNSQILNRLYQQNKKRFDKSFATKELKDLTNCLKYVLYKEIRKNFLDKHLFQFENFSLILSTENLYHIWIGHGINYKQDFNIKMNNQTLTTETTFNYSIRNVIFDLHYMLSNTYNNKIDLKSFLLKHQRLYYKFHNKIYVIYTEKIKNSENINISSFYTDTTTVTKQNLLLLDSLQLSQSLIFYKK